MIDPDFDPLQELLEVQYAVVNQSKTIEKLVSAFNERERIIVELADNNTQLSRLLHTTIVRLNRIETKLNEVK